MAARREYIKPEISSVVLIPDEAVLDVCKTTGSIGPAGQNCGVGGPAPCATPLS